jgi:hypothetical protein
MFISISYAPRLLNLALLLIQARCPGGLAKALFSYAATGLALAAEEYS